MKKENHQNKKNEPRLQKYCEIHGKCNHSTAQCELIQKQRNEYKEKNNKNNKDKNANERPRYNTRSNTQNNKKREENNNL